MDESRLVGQVLPGEAGYRVCTRCIMDTTDPDIVFDAKGVCDNCRRFETQLKVRVVPEDRRQEVLDSVVRKIKRSGNGREYDCIVGVSGGTDSTYLVYMAKKIGLRPLAVHFDNGWDSETAVRNIERTLKKLDVDLFTYVVDWDEFRDLQLSFLKASTPDAEIPTDHGIIALLYRVAGQRGIRYILDGTNFAAEGLGPETSWAYGHLDWHYIKSVQKKFGSARLKSFPHLSVARLAYHVLVGRTVFVSVLNYLDFSRDKAIATLTNELGWEYYGGKHCESVYTRFFQSYILPRKFHIDKRKRHLSSLIMSTKEITRERALEEIARAPMPDDVVNRDRAFVLKKLGLRETDFEKLMNLPVKSFRDYANMHSMFRLRQKTLSVGRKIGFATR
ncbi:MAG: N-acetyl sugar amidotransferase [Deltaproteobacteria bacterium]|nr:N-acetyl sugar amidotransferase [Deltaproteobacteria bacterium]